MSGKNKQISQTESIQKFIIEGREVIMKKEEETSFVRIRINSTDKEGMEKWRILINGNEFHTSEIIINCPSRTLTETFNDVGVKHHIICEAKEIIFKNNIATIN